MGAAATFVLADTLFNKGGATAQVQGLVGGGRRQSAPSAPAGPSVTSDADNENRAQKAAERRRRQYANVGRSSTILTGPGGVDMDDAANRLWGSGMQGKTLLGL